MEVRITLAVSNQKIRVAKTSQKRHPFFRDYELDFIPRVGELVVVNIAGECVHCPVEAVEHDIDASCVSVIITANDKIFTAENLADAGWQDLIAYAIASLDD